MKRCTRCLYPDTKPDLHFDQHGVCSACLAFDKRKEINWEAREKELLQILETAPGGGMYSTLAVVSRIGSVEPFARPRSLTNDIGGPPRLRFKEAQRKQKLKSA